MNAIHDGESATLKEFSFGSVQIDGRTCEHDVVIDRGKIRERKKNHPSNLANSSAARVLSIKEDITLEVQPARDRHRCLPQKGGVTSCCRTARRLSVAPAAGSFHPPTKGAHMFTRIVELTSKPGKVKELSKTITEKIVPLESARKALHFISVYIFYQGVNWRW